MLDRLERVLKFTDERARLQEEKSQRLRNWILNLVLLFLAIPTVLQLPAELIQASSSWIDHAEGARPAPFLEFFSTNPGGLWIIQSAGWVLLLCFVLCVIVWASRSICRYFPDVRAEVHRLTNALRDWPPRRE
jgi:hypothetical protein